MSELNGGAGVSRKVRDKRAAGSLRQQGIRKEDDLLIFSVIFFQQDGDFVFSPSYGSTGISEPTGEGIIQIPLRL